MAFNIPNQNSFAQFRPITTQTPWTRPSDWISITDQPNIVQFLVSDIAFPAYAIQTTFTQTGGVGNIYINWGDGVVDTVSTTTATNTEHVFSGGGGTYSTQGYNTWLVTISGDSGTRITAASFYNPTYWGAGVSYNTGLLEEYYGEGTILNPVDLHFTNTNVRPFFYSLQYSKLPSVMTGSTSMANTYYNCTSLKKVDLPTSMPGCTSFSQTFYQCYTLQSATLPADNISATTFFRTFYFAQNLTGMTFPITVSAATSFNDCFNFAESLKNITLPNFGAVANFNSMFYNCSSLLTVEVKDFGTYTGGTIDLSGMFQQCYSLEYIKFPTTVTTGQVFNMSNTFQNATSLKTATLPTNFNASVMTNAFNSCSSLTYVSMPTSMSSLTSLEGTFTNCRQLPSVTLPTTVGATMNLSSTFNGCNTMSTIVIPSSYNITTLANTFSNCWVLNNITLPTSTQNGITVMNNTFQNCYALLTVPLPSSLNGVTTLSTAFQNCYSLTGVTFPSTMNSVTTVVNAFNNCINMLKVTLPTSMSACNLFTNVFNNNYRLLSVTMPATVAASTTTFASIFNNCYSLKNVVLPTTQTTSVSVISSMFANCLALTGITNTQFLGSTSTTGTIANGDNFGFGVYELQNTQTFTNRLSKLLINGVSQRLSKLPGLRLSNTGTSQWGGTSPQIDISYTSLSTAALNLLFADMAAQGSVTSKTINITGALGAAGLSAADRLVITSKGWTITG